MRVLVPAILAFAFFAIVLPRAEGYGRFFGMRAEGRFSPAFMGQGFSAKRAIFRVVEKRRGMTGIDHPAIQQSYMLAFEHVLVVASHFMWAFTQAFLVVGTASAASTGVTKAVARPTATTTETSFFIWVLLQVRH